MKVATWNVNSLRARLDGVLRWTARAAPEVLCLQETKVTDAQFPREALAAAGYPHQAIYGQKTYNGVAIVSRLPLEEVVVGFSHAEDDPQARLVRARVDGVLVVDCYVPNGSALGSDKFSYKLGWLRRLGEEIGAAAAPDEDLVVVGDLNIALTDADVWDPFECDGELLYSEPERRALGAVMSWGLVDAYRALYPTGTGYTWWDYRGGGFRRNHGFRIDHTLLSRPLMDRCTGVEIHRAVRGWDKPSDHAPVVVELDR